MQIVAKFQLQNVNTSKWNPDHDGSHQFVFVPNYDTSIPEDQRFSRATPNGRFEMTVDNPPVVAFLKENHGKQFRVTFEVAD